MDSNHSETTYETAADAHEVSLRSIQETSPIESYEESLLMECLEQEDPTGSSMVYLDQAVALPDNFDGSDAATFASVSSESPGNNNEIPSPATDQAESSNGNPLVRPSLARQQNIRHLNDENTRKTVEEELFDLTKSINQSEMDQTEFAPFGHFYDYDGFQRRGSATQHDAFVANARTILRRITHYKGKKGSIDNSTSSPSSSINKQETERSSSGALIEAARDLGEFIKANRSNAYEYVRTIVIVYILPPTILAFLLFYVFGNPGASIGDSFNVMDDIWNSTLTEGVEVTLPPKIRKSKRWDGDTASYSWGLLFFVRQTITFSLARGIQFLIVSLAQKPPSSNVPRGIRKLFPTATTLGPMVRLILLQERGLPMQLQIWGILNFVLLYGTEPFAKNWLYYQDWLLICTPPTRENRGGNPSGGVTYHPIYRNLLLFAIIAGAFIGAKRFLMGLRFGKASYERYAGKLSDVLDEVVKVTKIARFASQQHRQGTSHWRARASASEMVKSTTSTIQEFWSGAEGAGRIEHQATVSSPSSLSDMIGTIPMSPDESANRFWETNNNQSNANVIDNNGPSDMIIEKMEQGAVAPEDTQHQVKPTLESLQHHAISDMQAARINELLGEWEDLDLVEKTATEKPSLSSIVQFRASCQVLDSPHPFSQAFGYARTRQEVMDCSHRIYRNLMEIQKHREAIEYDKGSNERSVSSLGTDKSEALSGPNCHHPVLRFQTLVLALKGKKHRKSIDPQKVKKLISMFRPARNGDITLLEFCKSIDTAYKGIRKLRASIANEGKMNAASENIVNTIFYFFMAWFGVAAIRIDPLALIGVLGSIIISISFMVGGASSDYFRGLLFILVQRPYDIGDRINVNGIETEADANGSAGWIVKDVTLYHTTVIYGKTQEYATYSNGALSQLRIINSARSPRAQLQFVIKFGIDVPHATIDEFQNELKAFVKSKPREWLAFTGFWLTNIEADQGFVAYKIMLQHRDSWQNLAALTTALADVRQYAVNLSKQKGMQYKSPPLPVEMRMTPGITGGSGVVDTHETSLVQTILSEQQS